MGRIFAALAIVSLGSATAVRAQEPPGEWTVSIGARESNEFSRTFDGVEQEDLILDNVNLGFGYTTRTERSRYGLFGRVGANAYREAEDRDHLNFGAGFSWSYTPSSRSSSTLTFGADRGFQAETLSNLGVLAPGIDSSAANATWSFQYRTSPRTTISTSVTYDYMRFETDQPIPGSQIVLGQSPFRDDFPRLFGEPRDDDEIVLPDPEGGVIDVLATEGFLGTSGAHSGTAIVGIGRQLSEYGSLGVDFGAGYRTIDRGDDRFLQEGAEGGLRFWAQRRSGRANVFGASYELHRSLILDPATTIQTVSGGYGFLPEESDVSLRFSGGASYYSAEDGSTLLTPVADFSFGAGLTRSTRVSALYRRQFSQAWGFGTTLLIDYANVSFTQQFGSKVDLTILAGGSFASDPLIEGSRYDAMQAGATLNYEIVESLSVGTSFFALKTEEARLTQPSETRRNLVSVFATYTATWR